MNRPITLQELKSVKATMESMLTHARGENWSELSRLDSKRRAILGYTEDTESPKRTITNNAVTNNPAVATPNPLSSKSESSPEYSALCDQLLALDESLSQIVQNARQSLVEENRGLRAQVSAKKNYAQICSTQTNTY